MAEISREQFNVQLTNAVRTTINLLEDAALFEEEVASIIGTVTPPLRRLTRKVIRASKSRGDSWGAKFIPRHVGALYGPAMLVKDVGDEPDGEENRDDEADDADERGLVILQPSSPYLFLKIVFYEPPAASDEPYLIFGRIRELVSKTANRRSTSPITIKRNRIKHLLSEIQPKSANRLIPTRAKFRPPGKRSDSRDRLCIVTDEIAYSPLYDLRDESGVTKIAEALAALAKRTAALRPKWWCPDSCGNREMAHSSGGKFNHQPAARQGGRRRNAPWRSVSGSRSSRMRMGASRWAS